MLNLLFLFATVVSAHPPEEGWLESVVVTKLPFPTARPPTDEPVCFRVSPTLQTSDTILDHDGLSISCHSTEVYTELCIAVEADAAWPSELAATRCVGDGHMLRASFKAGHDPFDDPADGVTVVRARGPEFLEPERMVQFAAPGWPDAKGTMDLGSCEVRDGVLTLRYEERAWRSRMTCSLAGNQHREVEVRLVDRRK